MSPTPRSLDVALESGVSNCARCGDDHEGPMDWRRFQRPVGGPGGEYRYWARCPWTGDPILLWVSDDDGVPG